MTTSSTLETTLYGHPFVNRADESSDEDTGDNNEHTSGQDDDKDDPPVQVLEANKEQPGGGRHPDSQHHLLGNHRGKEYRKKETSRPNYGRLTLKSHSYKNFSRACSGASAWFTNDAHDAVAVPDLVSAASSNQTTVNEVNISGASEVSSPITLNNEVGPEADVVIHDPRHLQQDVLWSKFDCLQADPNLSASPVNIQMSGHHQGSELSNVLFVRAPDSDASGTWITEI